MQERWERANSLFIEEHLSHSTDNKTHAWEYNSCDAWGQVSRHRGQWGKLSGSNPHPLTSNLYRYYFRKKSHHWNRPNMTTRRGLMVSALLIAVLAYLFHVPNGGNVAQMSRIRVISATMRIIKFIVSWVRHMCESPLSDVLLGSIVWMLWIFNRGQSASSSNGVIPEIPIERWKHQCGSNWTTAILSSSRKFLSGRLKIEWSKESQLGFTGHCKWFTVKRTLIRRWFISMVELTIWAPLVSEILWFPSLARSSRCRHS